MSFAHSVRTRAARCIFIKLTSIIFNWFVFCCRIVFQHFSFHYILKQKQKSILSERIQNDFDFFLSFSSEPKMNMLEMDFYLFWFDSILNEMTWVEIDFVLSEWIHIWLVLISRLFDTRFARHLRFGCEPRLGVERFRINRIGRWGDVRRLIAQWLFVYFFPFFIDLFSGPGCGSLHARCSPWRRFVY